MHKFNLYLSLVARFGGDSQPCPCGYVACQMDKIITYLPHVVRLGGSSQL